MEGNSTTQKAAVWVGLVFLLGAAIGGMGGYVYAHQKFAVTSASPSVPASDAARRQQKVRELTELAGLNAEQSHQVDGIIADVQAQMKTIRKTTDPQINEARETGRERIRAILTADQKPKFEEFIHKMDEERKRNAQ